MTTTTALRVAVIVGSTREGRFGPTVADWFTGQVRRRTDLDVDLIDLADFGFSPVLQRRRGPVETAFAERIARADGYVVVTPEYNHGYPAPLKHAIDLCHAEWRRKAVAFVSYGGISGGLRAVEQLRQVFAELHVATVRDSVSFALAGARFDEHGEPADQEAASAAVTVLLDELAWWAGALRSARDAQVLRSAVDGEVA